MSSNTPLASVKSVRFASEVGSRVSVLREICDFFWVFLSKTHGWLSKRASYSYNDHRLQSPPTRSLPRLYLQLSRSGAIHARKEPGSSSSRPPRWTDHHRTWHRFSPLVEHRWSKHWYSRLRSEISERRRAHKANVPYHVSVYEPGFNVELGVSQYHTHRYAPE